MLSWLARSASASRLPVLATAGKRACSSPTIPSSRSPTLLPAPSGGGGGSSSACPPRSSTSYCTTRSGALAAKILTSSSGQTCTGLCRMAAQDLLGVACGEVVVWDGVVWIEVEMWDWWDGRPKQNKLR